MNEDQLLIFYGMCGISQRYLVQGYKQNILDDKKSSKFILTLLVFTFVFMPKFELCSKVFIIYFLSWL